MITLYFGDNAYEFPNAWEELTPDQYLALVPLFSQLWAGELSLFDVRVGWFKAIAGLEDLTVPEKKLQRVADNIYTASRQFNFFFSIVYDGDISHFPPEARKMLKKHAPDDLSLDASSQRAVSRLDYHYKPDAVWAKNLIPSVKVRGRELSGWEVSVDGGALTSSLTAKQLTQGNDILEWISKRGTRQDLALLAMLLYPDPDAKLKPTDYTELTDAELFGISLNFQAFISFIFERTHYSILWARDDDAPKKKNLIATLQSDQIYSLSKSGFGDYEQIERMPATTYLGILRNEMISGVRSMYDSKVKVNDIAERTHLPIELILKIIS